MCVSLYEITADIIDAYDDSKLGQKPGMVTVSNEESSSEINITVSLDGEVRQVADTDTSWKSITEIIHSLAWDILIGSGRNAGCQLGNITYV